MLVVGGTEDDRGTALEVREMQRRFQPVHHRHRDIEQHRIDFQRQRPLDRLAAIACLAGNLPVR